MHRFIYMTAGSLDEARAIGRALLDDRLVACVNLFEGMHSLYRWEGAVQEEQECALIAKTTEALVPEVIDRVRDLHSYECPCVIALPVDRGNPAFLEWISGEVRKG